MLLSIDTDHGFTGLTGFAADVLIALGDFGVGLLVFLEVLIPPIPSEVILPFAGYLSQSGQLNLGWLIFWSTLASWIGALLLYGLGAAIGMHRAVRLLAATRLVSRSDLERGSEWFVRSGAWTVLVGRMVPGVRSLISIPAGAARMNLVTFSLFTIIGSGLWNTLLLGVGAALGTQHEQLEQYLGYLDYAVYTAIAIALVVLVVRRIREAAGERKKLARAQD
ncbi:DedA family protein [Microbacterium sp. KSW4-16]|uniref:DedA family protein n=1 Tax=Microbacterium aurugineum TaxID=2851642 RepID=A0ABY4J3S6_9MICO|nr:MULTISPECIES: DedA family protein [Microbacterium]PKQ36457.1 MAG: DedA family protein [Actinobacteria bacterium HGW-Actinobacteria-11]MCE0508437.1 DedA family protein [Microbacterium sp. KKR3/1]MCK8466616.1 DedA family protein [Microbacterium aurugineum]TCJ22244.1 DedA family protein [Microbacterium sp. PI-1]UPL18278.1 DedA family protein [Microbacterium aurugineum]